MKIEPIKKAGSHRTGRLDGITVEQVTERLGFAPNCEDNPYKVKHSWEFTVDGVHCGVWDYKGSAEVNSFSTYGVPDKLAMIFGLYYRHG